MDYMDPEDLEWEITHCRSTTDSGSADDGIGSLSTLSQSSEGWVDVMATPNDIIPMLESDNGPGDITSSEDVLKGNNVVSPQQILLATQPSHDAHLALTLDHIDAQQDFHGLRDIADSCGLFSAEDTGFNSESYQEEYDEPWSPVGPHRPYVSGSVAFLDSPASSTDHSFYEMPSSQHPREATSQDLQTLHFENHPPQPNTQKNDGQLQWILWTGAGCQTKDDNEDGKPHSRPVRSGPLTPQKAKATRKIRKARACWNCWAAKVSCSLGDTCKRCLIRQKAIRQKSLSPLADRLCCRSGFADYGVLYSPDVLTSHLTKEKVKDLITQNSYGFTDDTIDVEVTCGYSFASMELTVNIFKLKPSENSELRYHAHLTTQDETSTSSIILRPSAPIGLLGVDFRDLRRKCWSYIKSMVSSPDYPAQVTASHKSVICRRVLEIIHRYNNVEKHPLIYKAMLLHATHDFMKMIITFTDDSAAKVSTYIHGAHSSQDAYISSRLLNRQLKLAMHLILRGLTEDVLKGFEIELKKRDREVWPISFCVVLILSLCTEDIQIAADTFVSFDKNRFDGSRTPSFQICQKLEDGPYRQCTELFHDMYGTYKQPNGHGSDGGFNPIQRGVSDKVEWSQSARDMISGIRGIILDYKVKMTALTKIPVFGSNKFQTDHQSFLFNNPGRLVSKFLMSFDREC